jgi:hypothetical protein
MVLPPVTWKVSESKISDLECSSVSERNFRIRLFRLDRIDLVEAWQPTAQSTLKACNYSDRIRSLREVNEFTFDAFSVLRGTHRVSFSALGKKPSIQRFMRLLAAMDTMRKSRMVFFAKPIELEGPVSPQI